MDVLLSEAVSIIIYKSAHKVNPFTLGRRTKAGAALSFPDIAVPARVSVRPSALCSQISPHFSDPRYFRSRLIISGDRESTRSPARGLGPFTTVSLWDTFTTLRWICTAMLPPVNVAPGQAAGLAAAHPGGRHQLAEGFVLDAALLRRFNHLSGLLFIGGYAYVSDCCRADETAASRVETSVSDFAGAAFPPRRRARVLAKGGDTRYNEIRTRPAAPRAGAVQAHG